MFGFGTSTQSSDDGRFAVGGDTISTFEWNEVADNCESGRVGSFERADEELATAVSSVGDLYFRLAMLHVSTSCQLSLPTFRCLTYSEANVLQKSGLSRPFYSHPQENSFPMVMLAFGQPAPIGQIYRPIPMSGI